MRRCEWERPCDHVERQLGTIAAGIERRVGCTSSKHYWKLQPNLNVSIYKRWVVPMAVRGQDMSANRNQTAFVLQTPYRVLTCFRDSQVFTKIWNLFFIEQNEHIEKCLGLNMERIWTFDMFWPLWPALIFNTFVNRTGAGKCQILIPFKDLEHHLTLTPLFVVQLYHVISPIVEWCSTRTSTPQENGLCYSCAEAGFALWPLIIAFVPWRWHTVAKSGVTASALNQVRMGQKLWNCQFFGE